MKTFSFRRVINKKPFNLLVVGAVLLFSLVHADDSSSCTDVIGTFTTTKPQKGEITVSCGWVKMKNSGWRCTNLPNVATNCPVTCDNCSTSAPTLSATPTSAPTSSSSPSALYSWCKDSSRKFTIESLKWMQGRKKSCPWANEDGKKWFRCGIEEVKENCPVLCDFCQCKNNEGRFVLAPGLRKTCQWPKRSDSWWRCNTYPVLKEMCPLSCGECTDYQFPSDAPSAHPTIKLYSKHFTYVTVSIAFVNLIIPTIATELTAFKETLMEAYGNFVPSGGTLTGVEVYNTRKQSDFADTSAGAADFAIELEQTCYLSTSCGATEETISQSFVFESQSLAAAAANLTASTNFEIEFENLGGEEGNDLSGESLSSFTTTVIDPTAQPSASPEEHPSAVPSSQPSQRPTNIHSSKPSVVPSSMPTLSSMPSLAPTKDPTKRPTRSPTTLPLTNPPTLPLTNPPTIERQRKVEISITTDQWPGDTSWFFLEKSNGEIVSTGGPYDENFTTYDTELCVETWNCYTFTIFDDYGDGFLDGGSVVVKADDTVMLSTPAGGASFSVLDVDIGQCPTLPLTNPPTLPL